MTEIKFELATASDDEGIRCLLANNAVPGPISLTYEREPNYFLGCGTMGQFWQILVGRNVETNGIVGLGCRSTRPLYINGKAEEVGYVGQLRIDGRYRGRWLLAKGMKFAHELHGDGRVSGYITTIIEDNKVALGVLVDHPRGYHPIYRKIGQIHTLALMVKKHKRIESTPFEIGKGSKEELNEIIAFLTTQGPSKQFFPAYTEGDFLDSPMTLGFKLEDFAVARQNGRIVGVTGLWDQSQYKQVVVQGYSNKLKWARPLYNAAAQLTGRPRLPGCGEKVNHVNASFVCVEDNDPAVFRSLLSHVYNKAFERGYSYLALGLESRDTLLPIARRYPHITYLSNLYTVCWDDGGEFHERLDSRVPYVEIASI